MPNGFHFLLLSSQTRAAPSEAVPVFLRTRELARDYRLSYRPVTVHLKPRQYPGAYLQCARSHVLVRLGSTKIPPISRVVMHAKAKLFPSGEKAGTHETLQMADGWGSIRRSSVSTLRRYRWAPRGSSTLLSKSGKASHLLSDDQLK